MGEQNKKDVGERKRRREGTERHRDGPKVEWKERRIWRLKDGGKTGG